MQSASSADHPATVIEVRCRVDDRDAALHMLAHLVGERLAACGHVGEASPAQYWWQGQLVTDSEHELSLITAVGSVDSLVDELRQRHPYQLPGITWHTLATTADYADWVRAETDQRA